MDANLSEVLDACPRKRDGHARASWPTFGLANRCAKHFLGPQNKAALRARSGENTKKRSDSMGVNSDPIFRTSAERICRDAATHRVLLLSSDKPCLLLAFVHNLLCLLHLLRQRSRAVDLPFHLVPVWPLSGFLCVCVVWLRRRFYLAPSPTHNEKGPILLFY